jgi:inner membrane protein
MLGYSCLAVLPDLDVVAFRLDVPYAAPFGHRGAAHSLVAGALAGTCVALVVRAAGGRFLRTALLASLAAMSHGVLDAFTDGGRGIALLWPLTDARCFAPWQPIPVAPIGALFHAARGLRCVLVELAWFSPLLVWALWPSASISSALNARPRSGGSEPDPGQP